MENIFSELLTNCKTSVILYIKIECAHSTFYRNFRFLGRISDTNNEKNLMKGKQSL